MNIVDRAKYALIAYLADEVSTLTIGANLDADFADLRQGDMHAVAVRLEADPRRFYGSSRILYGVAEIQIISSTLVGISGVADLLMGLHGWEQPEDFPPDTATLPADWPAPADLRGVIRGMHLRTTRTDEDEETGATTRLFRYQVMFSGG